MGAYRTLDLDPDMGDVEFVEDIERVFGIALVQADVEHWLTLGDVEATLRRKVDTSVAQGTCGTMLAFNRIRRSLPADRETVRLQTPLSELAGSRPRDFFRRLQHDSGLRMPAPALSPAGTLVLLLWIAALVILVVALLSADLTVAAGALLVIAGSHWWFLRLDPGRMPLHPHTVGDLASWAARMNFALLRSEGARRGSDDVWVTLTVIAAEHADLNPAEISPDMFLFRKTAEKAGRAAGA